MQRVAVGRQTGSLIAVVVVVAIVGSGVVTGSLPVLAVGGVLAVGTAVLAIMAGQRLESRVTQLQESLQKTERMRLLGEVSGGLAHQLRNGVAGAKLAVQLHARSCANGDRDALDVARRQLARIEADLDRFLDMGRDLPRRPCRLVEMIEEAVDLLRPRCRHADVQVCWEPPPADPVVLGDPGRLGHVIVNLLTNAVEAAGPGGQVEVTVDQVPEGPCVVEVWDSGRGPNPALARRLFQPFVTGRADGIGLGLFVARQAVEEHGGRLDWRREPNRTCFRVVLPAMEIAITAEPAPVGGSVRE
jgi:signal transduction histidine kinase